MNMQNFTQKSIEALNEAQKIALQNQNMQIEEEHLLQALVNQQNGFIPELFKKMNVNVNALKIDIENSIKSIPAVTGSGREPDKVYISNDVDKALLSAESEAKKMQDEYVPAQYFDENSIRYDINARNKKIIKSNPFDFDF